MHPHLSDEELAQVTATELLEPVQERLGVSITTHVTDGKSCRDKLQRYLIPSSHSMPAFWPLVNRVEIRGRFPVLASGISLVDLPGDDDIDDMRDGFINNYIKIADGFVLVADVKRAQDERGTHDNLCKILNQLILDGRNVSKTVILVATRNDDVIGEDELHLELDDQLKLDALLKEINAISIAMSKKRGRTGKTGKELALDFREKQAEKRLFLANIRATTVRGKLQDMFIGLSTALDMASHVQDLPAVCCVASRDFLAIKLSNDVPVVFTDEGETGIPDLISQLSKTGQHRRLGWAIDELDRASAFCESIFSHFSEGRHPGELAAGTRAEALAIIAELEMRNLKEATELLESIQDEFKVVRQCVKKAVNQAAGNAPKIMERIGARGSMHWSTYRAMMRLNGLYPPHDLNRDLTKGILPDIQRSWNLRINHRMPLILRDAVKNFIQATCTAVEAAVETLNGQGPTFQQAVANARQSLAIEGMLGDMLERSLETISVAQQNGTRAFKTILQNQMRQQYLSVSQINGPGTWDRMRESNQEYMEDNAKTIFNAVNIHIAELFRRSSCDIEQDIQRELKDLTILLRLALIDDINLSQDHKAVRDEILQIITATRPAFNSRKIVLRNRLSELDDKPRGD
ncbi:hypothetical protein B0H15DRAFT_198348 [Mycena belliarum]|uniref:Uncharacterized protein n=1 Tax=Mycena belliarum TaxID=1033014 RepID=A0AAD6UH57_9AGAR|nr:hypothetical protein B0H15DRAFT_198348 [Mycena belliae]